MDKVGYDALVKVLIDCEVRLGSKVEIVQVQTALMDAELGLSEKEACVVVNALREKDDLVQRGINVAKTNLHKVEAVLKKVATSADKAIDSAVGKINRGAEVAKDKLQEGANFAKERAKGALAGVEAAADKAVTGAREAAGSVQDDEQLFGSKKLKKILTVVTKPETLDTLAGKDAKMLGSRRLAGICNVLFPPDKPGDLGIVQHGTTECTNPAPSTESEASVDKEPRPDADEAAATESVICEDAQKVKVENGFERDDTAATGARDEAGTEESKDEVKDEDDETKDAAGGGGKRKKGKKKK